MAAMILVDTSSWTQALRRAGDATVRSRVQRLLADGSAVWCNMVRLELWAGVRGQQERHRLEQMEAVLPNLPIVDRTWEVARDYASRARKSGLTVPSADLLIFACSKLHAVEIECADKHFALLKQL